MAHESRYRDRHAPKGPKCTATRECNTTASRLVRLGDGTPESHARMQRALDTLWPYTAEFFATFDDDAARVAAGVGTAWPQLESRWTATVAPVLGQALLTTPARTTFASTGTRGVHSEHLGHLLAEMQYLQRAVPGGTW